MTFKVFERFTDALKLFSISATTYNISVKKYISPVVKNAWYVNRKYVMEKIKDQAKLHLAGDGQFDSPGFSAKYCVYSIIDVLSNYILDFVFTQRKMFQGDLENNCCDPLLTRLTGELGHRFYLFLTDRHAGVGLLMRTKFSAIIHEFDLWHLTKSFTTSFYNFWWKKLNRFCIT